MIEILAVATITVLAVVSPGADFAMVTRNSLLQGRSSGLLAALGIAAGVQVHVMYTMLGVGLLIQQSPEWFAAIKYAGALYLIYVGYQTGFGQPRPDGLNPTEADRHTTMSALRTGFLTNALNPKTTLFVVSVYTQVVHPDTPLGIQIGYGLFMSLAHAVWFSLVAIFFSDPTLRRHMLSRQVALNRVIGGVLCLLGVSLLFASAANP